MRDQRSAIIIPCYNEAKRLANDEFSRCLAQDQRIFFFFVNDGSRDQTQEILSEFCRKHHGRADVITLQENVGKAEAVRQGFLKAGEGNFSYIGYWDADLATPLKEIEKFLGILSEEKILAVMGSRVRLLGRNIQRKITRHYFGRVFATVASCLLGLPVYDTQCGAKIFRNAPYLQKVMATPFLSRWLFDVEILARLILAVPGGRAQIAEDVVEFPLSQWVEVGTTKVRWADYFFAMIEIIRINWEFKRALRQKQNGI